MTGADVALVQSSFAKVVPIQAQAAAIFYARVFELAPSVRLFSGDMTEQGSKLMAMLSAVVGTLDGLDVLVPVAQRLAVRHVAYGAEPAHYAMGGAALLDTLQAGLGADFTAETRAARASSYGTLSSVMVAAAEAPGEQAAA
jgi:hemoglobin-like flavoprotein